MILLDLSRKVLGQYVEITTTLQFQILSFRHSYHHISLITVTCLSLEYVRIFNFVVHGSELFLTYLLIIHLNMLPVTYFGLYSLE